MAEQEHEQQFSNFKDRRGNLAVKNGQLESSSDRLLNESTVMMLQSSFICHKTTRDPLKKDGEGWQRFSSALERRSEFLEILKKRDVEFWMIFALFLLLSILRSSWLARLELEERITQ